MIEARKNLECKDGGKKKKKKKKKRKFILYPLDLLDCPKIMNHKYYFEI